MKENNHSKETSLFKIIKVNHYLKVWDLLFFQSKKINKTKRKIHNYNSFINKKIFKIINKINPLI